VQRRDARDNRRQGLGDLRIAIVREVLSSARSLSDTYTLLVLLENLAGYLAAVDDVAGALAAAREVIGLRSPDEPDHYQIAFSLEHAALALALRGEVTRSAILAGYAGATIERHRLPRQLTETTTHNRLTALLRERLRDELAGLTAQGAALTPESAAALALADPQA